MFIKGDKQRFQKMMNDESVYGFRSDKDVFLNRGAILHGECLSYNKEEWSAQLIYFSDFVNHLISHKWEPQILSDSSKTLCLIER